MWSVGPDIKGERTGYAENNLAQIHKNSLDLILEKINAWDKDMTYTYELKAKNKLNFLSSTLFVAYNSIKSKTFRKEELNKVMNNYKKSVPTRGNLISNIHSAPLL